MKKRTYGRRALSWLLAVSMMTPGMGGLTTIYAQEEIVSEDVSDSLGVPPSLQDTGIRSAEDIVYFVDCGITDVKNQEYESDSPYYEVADMLGGELATLSNASLASPSDVEAIDLATGSNAKSKKDDAKTATDSDWDLTEGEILLIDDVTGRNGASGLTDITVRLLNDTPDQEYIAGENTWGYTKTGNVKAYDKKAGNLYGTGYYDKDTEYTITLGAGSYTLVSGHREWWGQEADRTTDVYLSIGGGSEKKAASATVNKNTLTDLAKAAFTVDQDNTKVKVRFTGNGNVVSWFAIVDGELEKPQKAVGLEDQGEVSTRTGAALVPDLEDGEMISVTEGWISGGNSAVDGGGVITDAEKYLKKSQFTLYTDFSFQETNDNTSALLIGNEENHIRLIPAKTDGKAILRVHTGGKDTDYALTGEVAINNWHAVAVLYHEEGGQGSVSLCLDGKEVLAPVEIGFLLSELDGIVAGFGITYKTGFMRTGNYDYIVALDEMVQTDAAKEETKARAEHKNSLNADRIVIDGKAVEEAAKNMNGLTFKGFGLLDCNSTNALLLDYKAKHPDRYQEMLEILFGGEHPIMQHIKIEMGNDKNTSTGPQACTMRTSDEYPDVTRVTGFQLVADVKEINPDVKVSLLYWCSPGWVGEKKDNAARYYNNVYKWLKNTSIAAYREYGYMVDIISPGINEQKDDPSWMKDFNNRVETDTEGMINSDPSVAGFRDGEAELFHKIQVIMSDEVGIASCGSEMIEDEDLRNAVDIVAYHYNTDDDSNGSFKRLAEEFDKEIWNSEAQATFGATADRPNNNMQDNADPGTGIGGNGGPLEMANTAIKGFVNSRRTHFVYQPTIGAFYEGTQYNYKDVMQARDPWSGYVNYDAALNIMQHFTKFAVTGWEYDTPDENVVWRGIPSASKSTAKGTNPVNGRNGGDNYMTLAAPDKSAFSVILNNDSGKEKTFTIYPRDLELGANPQLEIWETRAADEGQVYNENYMKCVETLSQAEDGTFTVTVKPWSIVTATTLDMDGQEAELALPTASEDGRYVLDTDETGKEQNTEDGYLYADDFNYDGMDEFIESRGGRDGFYPLYTQDVNGSFEVVMDGDGNGVLRMNGQTGGGWWNGGEPATTIGDYRWTNYKVSVDFNLNSTSEYLLLGARQRGAAGGGDNKVSMSAYNLALNRNGSWILRRHSSEIARGDVRIKNPAACNVALRLAGDTVTVYIEGNEVHTYTDPNPQLEGRIMLGVGLPGASWTAGEFDNLKVETVPGYMPYLAMVHDNLHMKKWGGDEAGQDALVYDGDWSHRNQVGSNLSQRTLSSTSQTGASISYTFTGTGLALIGPNGGSAKVDVTVDGKTLYTNAPTVATESHQPYFVIRGLENGEHTVTVSLAAGTLEVDSVGYIAANETTEGDVDLKGLEDVVAAMDNMVEGDYDQDAWNAYQAALKDGYFTVEMAKNLIADRTGFGVDQEGVDAFAAYFRNLTDKLVRHDAPVEIISTESIPKMLALPAGGTLSDLKGGQLPAAVPVKKVDGSIDEAAEILWSLSGDTQTAYGSATATGTVTGGKNLMVTVPVEVVPEGLVYFIDQGTEDQTVYDLYKAVQPDLKNDRNDQLSEGGSWGRNGGTTKANTNPFSKLDTGIYSGNDIVYTLPLEAGIYTVTAGFTEWWGYGRDMKQTISYTTAGGDIKTIEGDAVSFGSRGNAVSATSFVLPEAATVTYTLAKTKSQDSVISWLAVARISGEEEAGWEPIFRSDESNQWAGLNTFGTVVTQDDEEQGEVLHMNAAGTTYIQFDPETIDFSGREYMTLGFDLKSETADGNFFTVAIGQDTNKYFYMRTREHDTYTAITKGSYQKEQGATAQVDTLNQWVRVELVFTPEQIITYMDGVPVSTIEKSILVTDLGADPVVYLGRSFYSGDKYFKGAFDNIEVYGRARSAEEVALSYAVDAAGKRVKSDYTEDSWNVFAAALDEAEAVLGDASETEAGRAAAKNKLQAAAEALVKVTPAMALAELVKEAEALRAEDYTADSWSILAAAVQGAKAALGNPPATDEEIDAAKVKLQEAMKALVKAADKAALKAQVEEAKKLDGKAYTSESWKTFEEALAAAQKVMADTSATQKAVDEANTNLVTAMENLVKAEEEEPSGLSDLVKEADRLKKKNYTSGSWKAFAKALDAAKEALANEAATAQEKAEAERNLKAAMDALVKAADTEALETLVQEAEALNEADYTSESWNTLAEALKAARQLLADGDVSQEEVDKAAAAIEKAVESLEKKPEDKPDDKPDDDDDSDSGDYSNSTAAGGTLPGITSTDAKKGQVNTERGIITGTGDGYSRWISEVAQDGTERWKLTYADGTTAAGSVVTDASGKAYEQPIWELINGAWYAFGSDGYAKSGLVEDPALGGIFYIDINTGMKTGWQLVDGVWRYFNPVSDGKKGIMLVDTWVDGRYIDSDGIWAQ